MRNRVLIPIAALMAASPDPEHLNWVDLALCAEVDPEIFFPERGGSVKAAKSVCRACESRAECLDYALEHDEPWGIWGGMTERERRMLARQRQEMAA